ncbi:cyclin-A1 [Pelobates fuscus]|uniref:cyclin-A1 n=1 Tax=Pelobates fuscus TaxID=191477 RepID=UPI002FE4DB43
MRRSIASNSLLNMNSTIGIYSAYQNPSLPNETIIQTNMSPQRTVLGVISGNEQYRRTLGQACSLAAAGVKNELPLLRKVSCLPVAKPSFTIYVDEPVVKQEKCSFEVEFPSFEEADVNIVKQSFHLLLDISTSSPMMVDASMDHHPGDGSEMDPDAIVVSEYMDDIHKYLREAEVRHRPKALYMRKQPDITPAMRTILVDWLVEVSEEYKLRCETLYLAINYLDRFLSCMSVLRGKLQLVGTASILLASKYEEIYPPDLDEFVYITDDTYTKKQLLRTEHLLLKVLAFDLTVPTINQFLLQYLKRHSVCPKTEQLAMYFAELTLLEVEPFLKYLPSMTAAAAYCLANYTINKTFWPQDLVAFTDYTLSEIVPCISDLHRLCLHAPHQVPQAIREKYKTPKHMQVSLIELPANLPLK